MNFLLNAVVAMKPAVVKYSRAPAIAEWDATVKRVTSAMPENSAY